MNTKRIVREVKDNETVIDATKYLVDGKTYDIGTTLQDCMIIEQELKKQGKEWQEENCRVLVNCEQYEDDMD